MARCEVGWLLRHSVVLSVEVWSFGRAAGWYMYLGCTVLQSVVGSVIRLYFGWWLVRSCGRIRKVLLLVVS